MKYKTINVAIEIPDELIDKTIAIINEAFDRANQFTKIDGKEKVKDINDKRDKFIDVIFPIFPNSFYQVDKIHKTGTREIIKNNKWTNFWHSISYKDIPLERIEILNKLNEIGAISTEDIPDADFPEDIEDKGLIIDLFKDKLVRLRKRLVEHRDRLEKSKAKTGNAKLSFKYKKYETSAEVKLKFPGHPEITFTKHPAAILNFFFKSGRTYNEYRNYKDFQVFYAKDEHIKNISSDEFSKKIKAINKRIRSETKGLIKEIMVKEKNRSNEANAYKLKEFT